MSHYAPRLSSRSSNIPLFGREETAASSWDSTNLAEFLLPESRVELAEDGLDLPGLLLATLVGSLEDVDALDRGKTLAESYCPPESNGVTRDCFNGEDVETNRLLGTLASNECLLAWEGGAAERIWKS